MRLTHVRLLVDDYRACFRFYRDVLGLEPAFGDEESGYADFATAGGAILALFSRAEQGGVVGLRLPGDSAIVVLAVDDVDAFAERRREHVLADPESRAEWGIRFVHLRDPDGNLIEVNQQVPMPA